MCLCLQCACFITIYSTGVQVALPHILELWRLLHQWVFQQISAGLLSASWCACTSAAVWTWAHLSHYVRSVCNTPEWRGKCLCLFFWSPIWPCMLYENLVYQYWLARLLAQYSKVTVHLNDTADPTIYHFNQSFESIIFSSTGSFHIHTVLLKSKITGR